MNAHSLRSPWGHSGCTPGRSSRCQQLIEQFQSRLMATSGSITESPTTTLYSSRFLLSLTGSRLHLNSIPVTATPLSPLKLHCDTPIYAALVQRFWQTVLFHYSDSELHFVLIFFLLLAMMQRSPQLSQVCRSPGQLLHAWFPFLKEACFLISATMFPLSSPFLFQWLLCPRISLLDAEWVCTFSQQKTVFPSNFCHHWQ